MQTWLVRPETKLPIQRRQGSTSLEAYLLENSLPDPDKSCEGEPAPDRVVPAILLPAGFNVPDMPKGDLTADAPDDSMGD